MADLFKVLGYGVYATRAGDIVSTELALRRANTYEANPLMRNRTIRMTSSVATAVGINYMTSKLHKHHPRAALWVRIATVVGWGYVTAHNLRVGR